MSNSRLRSSLLTLVFVPVVSFLSGRNVAAQATNCVPPPAGLVSWWRGESNALDSVGTNHGTLVGDTTFGASRVGQGFLFDGSGDAVDVGNPTNLQLQNLTIEAWIKRGSPTVVSLDPYQSANIFACTWGGYALGITDDGRIYLSKVGFSGVYATTPITDTVNFHHLAATKSGNTVMLYVDGIGESVGPYNPGFTFGGPSAIGTRGSDYVRTFLGRIDEVSIYNRALSAA